MIISAEDALSYEIRSSRLAPHLANSFLQRLASLYFAWRVNRKYPRYRRSFAWQEADEAFRKMVP